MQCPVCAVDLLLAERHGIEIDYCPKCRGIWLDRGELDKIISRAARPEASGPYDQPESQRPPREHRYDHPKQSSSKPPHKRKSFLQEIFDFD